jgi:hypothetical protein
MQSAVDHNVAPSTDQPWYVSAPFLLFAVVFLTPAWIAIKLAKPGRQRIKVARIALAVYGIMLVVLANDLLGHPFSTIFGPAEIEFGPKYIEAPGRVSLLEKKSNFSNSDPVAWLVYLKRPVQATSVDLSLSKVTESGGDLVVIRGPIYVADPNYNILFGQLNPFILISSGPGRFRVYITLGNDILARGEFNVTKVP